MKKILSLLTDKELQEVNCNSPMFPDYRLWLNHILLNKYMSELTLEEFIGLQRNLILNDIYNEIISIQATISDEKY